MAKKCQFVYYEDAEDHQEGERCRSTSLHKSGFCFHHAAKLNVLDKNELEKYKESRKIANKKRSNTIADRKTEKINQRKDLYNKIIGDDYFDLRKRVDALDAVGFQPVASLGKRKALFVLWWIADPQTRQPKSIERVAKLINVKPGHLYSWEDRPWFIQMVEEQNRKNLRKFKPHISKIMLLSALSGDKAALELYHKELAKPDVVAGNENDFEGVPQELLDEAENEVLDGKDSIRLSKEEQDVFGDSAEVELEAIALDVEHINQITAGKKARELLDPKRTPHMPDEDPEQ